MQAIQKKQYNQIIISSKQLTSKKNDFLGERFSSVFLSIISDTATFQGRFGHLVSIESSCFFACQWVRDLQP